MEPIRYLGKRKTENGNAYNSWSLFQCPVCNKIVERRSDTGKRNKSCGCHRLKWITKHGDAGSPIYRVWTGMIERCRDKKGLLYKYYGNKGIRVTEEWHDYPTFKEWALKNGFEHGLDIDRIDGNGNYCPDNCRFVTRTENARNSSATKLTPLEVMNIKATYKSGQITQTRLGKIYDVSVTTIHSILTGKTWIDI